MTSGRRLPNRPEEMAARPHFFRIDHHVLALRDQLIECPHPMDAAFLGELAILLVLVRRADAEIPCHDVEQAVQLEILAQGLPQEICRLAQPFNGGMFGACGLVRSHDRGGTSRNTPRRTGRNAPSPHRSQCSVDFTRALHSSQRSIAQLRHVIIESRIAACSASTHRVRRRNKR